MHMVRVWPSELIIAVWSTFGIRIEYVLAHLVFPKFVNKQMSGFVSQSMSSNLGKLMKFRVGANRFYTDLC